MNDTGVKIDIEKDSISVEKDKYRLDEFSIYCHENYHHGDSSFNVQILRM